MSSSKQRPANRGFHQFVDAPYPIILKFLRCLHQNPGLALRRPIRNPMDYD